MRAFILAAGKGERLRPLTEKTPKPLIPIGGVPILERVLGNLESLPIEKVVINAWYHKDQILRFVEQKASHFRFSLEVSMEDELLGTGGGLKKALPLLGPAPFLVLNADCLWRGNLDRFIDFAKLSNAEASWLLTDEKPEQTRIGSFENELCQIGELWKRQEADTWGCFTGIQWIQKIEASELPDQGCLIRNYWLPRLKGGSRISTFGRALDFWEDLGTPERLKQVDDAHSRLP